MREREKEKRQPINKSPSSILRLGVCLCFDYISSLRSANRILSMSVLRSFHEFVMLLNDSQVKLAGSHTRAYLFAFKWKSVPSKQLLSAFLSRDCNKHRERTVQSGWIDTNAINFRFSLLSFCAQTIAIFSKHTFQHNSIDRQTNCNACNAQLPVCDAAMRRLKLHFDGQFKAKPATAAKNSSNVLQSKHSCVKRRQNKHCYSYQMPSIRTHKCTHALANDIKFKAVCY